MFCCACCHAWCRHFGSPLQFIFVERWIVAQHLLHITPIPRCRVQTGLLLFQKGAYFEKKGAYFSKHVFFIMMRMLMLLGHSVSFAVFVFAIGCCMWSCFGFLGCLLLWFYVSLLLVIPFSFQRNLGTVKCVGSCAGPLCLTYVLQVVVIWV